MRSSSRAFCFNGLEGFVKSLYESFDPELKIIAKEGKGFVLTDTMLRQIKDMEGVEYVTEVIEDKAYVKYGDHDMVVTLKGVSDNFLDQHRLENSLVQGEAKLKNKNNSYAVIGRGVQYGLNVAVKKRISGHAIYYPRKTKASASNPLNLINQLPIYPIGVFAIENSTIFNYVFCSPCHSRKSYSNMATSVLPWKYSPQKM